MEDKALGPKNNSKARIPPKRGQIKIKIFKMMANSLVSLASNTFNSGKTNKGGGGCLGAKPILPIKSANEIKPRTEGWTALVQVLEKQRTTITKSRVPKRYQKLTFVDEKTFLTVSVQMLPKEEPRGNDPVTKRQLIAIDQ
ncbi:hypothetical protein ACH5RR_009973, partial [Cinchona calisaya]